MNAENDGQISGQESIETANEVAMGTACVASKQNSAHAYWQRLIVVILLFSGWIFVDSFFVIVMEPYSAHLHLFLAEEAELNHLESFSRFCQTYCYTAFTALGPTACLATWFVLTALGVRKTRWYLLGIGIAIAPVLIGLTWLLVRLPYYVDV